MIYVEKVTIKNNQDYPGSDVLKKGFSFDCQDINLFVGAQGCGKSTLLNMMNNNHKDLDIKLSSYTISNGVETRYFDTEKQNPRIQDLQHLPSEAYAGAVQSHFMSHGEALVDITVNALFKFKNTVLFLDEPESGLSITNQFKLIKGIETAVKNGCQLFIATHCYPLISEFEVISLEHNRKMSGANFISLVR